MRIFDISVPLAAGLPTWPGDPCFQLEPVLLLEQGDEARVARLTLGDHSGTHLDAPAHMLADGSNLDSFSLSRLMGPALVADLRGVTEIGVQELAGLPLAGVERLLLKTDNSRLWDRAEFCREFAALSAAGAELLVSKGIRLVGIDYLSIERFGGDGSVHHILLGNEVLILEGLDLAAVPAGEYELICLPLRITGAAGAPARAILRQF